MDARRKNVKEAMKQRLAMNQRLQVVVVVVVVGMGLGCCLHTAIVVAKSSPPPSVSSAEQIDAGFGGNS